MEVSVTTKQPVVIPLDGAIASILGRVNHPNYVDIGHSMKVQDLYQFLGLSNSPMLYHYMSGKTKKIEPDRAIIILKKFNILINLWEDVEELKKETSNIEVSSRLMRGPVDKILSELEQIEQMADFYEMKKGIKILIGRYS